VKIRTLYARFREAYKIMLEKGIGFDNEFVLVRMDVWQKSLETYRGVVEGQRIIGQKVN
jgi:hypothetical protein